MNQQRVVVSANVSDLYDSVQGIETFLHDLNTFQKLRKLRVKAGYDDKQRLHEFLVLGRYWLDSCGNCMLIDDLRWNYEHDVSFIRSDLPKVVERDKLMEILPKIVYRGTLVALPTHESVCDLCGEGWTLENAHDSVQVLNEDYEPAGYAHVECHALRLERKYRALYADILTGAGLVDSLTTPIPNEYWSTGPSWCLLTTHRGNIKIGWRKRVINLDWSDAVNKTIQRTQPSSRLERHDHKRQIEEKLSAETLFPDEKVTKGEAYIHAWSIEDASKYLHKVATVLKVFRVQP